MVIDPERQELKEKVLLLEKSSTQLPEPACSGMVCWAPAALCCGLATACDLPRLSNRPLSWPTVPDVLDSPSGMCLACQHRQLELASSTSKSPHLTESVSLLDLLNGLLSSFTIHLNTHRHREASVCNLRI